MAEYDPLQGLPEDDEAIDHIVNEFATAFDEEIMSKSTYDLLVDTLKDTQIAGTMRDFAVDLMQQDELLLIGVYKDAPQEPLKRADFIAKLLASPFAGICIFDSRV